MIDRPVEGAGDFETQGQKVHASLYPDESPAVRLGEIPETGSEKSSRERYAARVVADPN
jgi:hypothetical protein